MSNKIFNKEKTDKKISKILRTLNNCNQFEIETILGEVKKGINYFPLKIKL